MKKIVIILVFVFTAITLNAQQHETKVDVFNLVAFKSLETTYMYILNEESGVGISVFMRLADKKGIFGYNKKLAVTPFYRQYFPLGSVENVFAEAFFSLNSGTDLDDNDEVLKYTDGAFGFTVGKSYISPRGFVAEIFIGAGRNLFDSPGAPNLVSRIGVNFGFRF